MKVYKEATACVSFASGYARTNSSHARLKISPSSCTVAARSCTNEAPACACNQLPTYNILIAHSCVTRPAGPHFIMRLT